MTFGSCQNSNDITLQKYEYFCLEKVMVCAVVILIVALVIFLWIWNCRKCWDKQKGAAPPVKDVKFGYDASAQSWRFYWPQPTAGYGVGYFFGYIWQLQLPNGTEVTSQDTLLTTNYLDIPTPVLPGTYTLRIRARNQIGNSDWTFATGVVPGPVQLQLEYLPTASGEFNVHATYSGSVSGLTLSATTQSLGSNGQLGQEIPLPLLQGTLTSLAPLSCVPNSGGGTTCIWTFGYGTAIIQSNGSVDATKVLREWNTMNFTAFYTSQGQMFAVKTSGKIPGVSAQPIPQSEISFGFV